MFVHVYDILVGHVNINMTVYTRENNNWDKLFNTSAIPSCVYFPELNLKSSSFLRKNSNFQFGYTLTGNL